MRALDLINLVIDGNVPSDVIESILEAKGDLTIDDLAILYFATKRKEGISLTDGGMFWGKKINKAFLKRIDFLVKSGLLKKVRTQLMSDWYTITDSAAIVMLSHLPMSSAEKSFRAYVKYYKDEYRQKDLQELKDALKKVMK